MSEINELMLISNKIKSSSIVPQHLRSEGELLAAMLFVKELGLPIMSGLQNVAVINGKPTLNSHLLWALVMKQADLKKVEIKSDETKATVKIEREKGVFESSFSLEDAKKAGLIKSGGAWEKYPKQMMEARAKSLCARLAYPEALFGIYSTEELKDATPFNNNEQPLETKAEVVEQKPSALEGIDQKRKEELELKKKKRAISDLLKNNGFDEATGADFLANAKRQMGITSDSIDSLEEAGKIYDYCVGFFENGKGLKEPLEADFEEIKNRVEKEQEGLFEETVATGGYGND